jgi:calcineurin-like phosphoesterase family protein
MMTSLNFSSPPKWVISDTHFFHKNIIRYCSRPWESVDEMNEGLIQRWNESIKDDDVVILAGDVAFTNSSNKLAVQNICRRLAGRKYLVKGNHDGKNEFYLEAGFVDVVDYIVVDNILIAHYPPVGDESGCKKTLSLVHQHKCDFVVHGHQHTSIGGGHLFNACVDINDWRPISWDTIIQNRDLHISLNLIPAWKSGVCQEIIF